MTNPSRSLYTQNRPTSRRRETPLATTQSGRFHRSPDTKVIPDDRKLFYNTQVPMVAHTFLEVRIRRATKNDNGQSYVQTASVGTKVQRIMKYVVIPIKERHTNFENSSERIGIIDLPTIRDWLRAISHIKNSAICKSVNQSQSAITIFLYEKKIFGHMRRPP